MASTVKIYCPRDGVPPLSEEAMAKENKIEEDARKDGRVLLYNGFPFRPGYGSRGRRVKLFTNHVELNINPRLDLHRYTIAVSPGAVGRKRLQIIQLFMKTLPQDVAADMYTDFNSSLYCRQKASKDTANYKIPYRQEHEDRPSATATQYTVTLTYNKTLRVADLISYLASTDPSASYDDKIDMIQALDIFFVHFAKSSGNLVTVGANKIYSLAPGTATYNIGHGLHAIRGFSISVRLATGRNLINVQVKNGAFYNQGPLDQLITSSRAQDPKRLEVFLKRVRVNRTHLNNNAPKSIIALAHEDDGRRMGQRHLPHPPKVSRYGAGAKEVEFWLQEGEASGRYITVHDFFLQKYGRLLAKPNMPVVNVGSRNDPIYLPPEVCVVLPGQHAGVQLNPAQTQQMIRYAVRKPFENAASVVDEGLKMVGLLPEFNPKLKHFGLSINPSLIAVAARVLQCPGVVYQAKKPSMNPGSWNLKNQKFNVGGRLQKWSTLILTMPSTRQDAFDTTTDPGQTEMKKTLDKFVTVLRSTGIKVEEPLPSVTINVDNTARDENIYKTRQTQIANEIEDAMQRAAQRLELLLVILPVKVTSHYNLIKRLGDVKYGITTVCTIGSLLAKNQDQYFSNVAMKLNLKLGGSNHYVEKHRLGLIAKGKTMIVGIDVTHPSPGSHETAPSIAGMVACTNSSLGQWPGILAIQSRSRQEMVSGLKDMLKFLLRLWKTQGGNTSLPEDIVAYRDGVSEMQYRQVMEQEVVLFRTAFDEMYSPEERKRGLPRLTVIVVGKRHSQRFYPMEAAGADHSSNTVPGTVVDRGVTEARAWDFYLQAHAALQGTARPAHYYVILDEVFSHHYRNPADRKPFANVADVVEDLTLSLSYTYGRATKGVRVCTPAYYADILCERARCYLPKIFIEHDAVSEGGSSVAEQGPSWSAQDIEINARLRNTMFYI